MAKGPNTAPGPLSEAVAEQLRAQRGKLNYSVAALARTANVDRTALGYILKGKKTADIEVLEDVCAALNLTLSKVVKSAEAAVEGLRFEN
jgi:transcriptional regulator with XRE-family HTH domain